MILWTQMYTLNNLIKLFLMFPDQDKSLHLVLRYDRNVVDILR